MRRQALRQYEKGVTLFVALIMLLLITMTVVTAFNLSSTNLKLVGNMQMRDEAIASANSAIEQVISSPFTDDITAAAQTIAIDIDNDDDGDQTGPEIEYMVNISQPQCVSRAEATSLVLTEEGVENTTNPNTTVISQALGTPPPSTTNPWTSAPNWNTVWDIQGVVTDPKTGANVTVAQGIRVFLLSQTMCADPSRRVMTACSIPSSICP